MKKGNTSDMIKSTQEQATAAWINELNQTRLNTLTDNLDWQDDNLENAFEEISKLKEFVGNPSHILGKGNTKHGEIAEHVQVNISNARRMLEGEKALYTFDGVGRTAREDYLYAGHEVQSKFYNGAKNTLNQGVKGHITYYSDFVKNGGQYVIPKDQYEEIIRVTQMAKETPSALNKTELSLVKKVEQFEISTGLDIHRDVRPAIVRYDEVQQGTVKKTILKEENSLHKRNRVRQKEYCNDALPTVKEGVYAAEVSAALEGGVAFCLAVAQKRKSGKQLSQFTAEDWKEVGIDTAVAATKGGIRGAAVYTLSNFTTTPANVATGYVTAVFGVVSQAKEYEKGNISKEDFVINSEAVCLDVTISAISALAGQVIIPVPVLGAIIGNIAGQFVSSICKEYAGQKEQDIIFNYRAKTAQLRKQIEKNYESVVAEVQKSFERFTSLEVLAFDKDVNVAFAGSIALAQEAGVDLSEILCSKKDIDNYFMK